MAPLRCTAKQLLASFSLFLAFTALASDWKYHEARGWGFSMLVPAGVAVREREWGGGWGGINANYEGVKLFGLAKLGAHASDTDIENFAVRTIGVPSSGWTMVDSGTHQRGWARYKTFRASSGEKLFFGGYGVGPKGNYLVYLETTQSDYDSHRADYLKWYESVRLD